MDELSQPSVTCGKMGEDGVPCSGSVHVEACNVLIPCAEEDQADFHDRLLAEIPSLNDKVFNVGRFVTSFHG